VYDLRVRWLVVVVVVAAGVGTSLWFTRDRGSAAPSVVATPPAPPPAAKAGFVGSETCKECHEERHATWLNTAHAYSLREASAESVAGRFDGERIDTKFFAATPYMQNGLYYMRVEGKDGRPSGDYRVDRVVGRSFEQAYLLTGPRGEWRVLPLCWSLARQEWDQTHIILADIVGGGEAFPANYDSRNHVFNDGCAQCHATNYDVGHDPENDTYTPGLLEGAVACESCHGPGSIHVKWHEAERGTDDDYADPARLVHPREDLDAKAVLLSCGRCHYMHEWRYAIDDDPRVGYLDIAISENRDQPGFHADGRLAGLNYHGSTQSQSACYQKGEMSCLHCHRMHGKRKWAMKWPGDSEKQCAKCHQDKIDDGANHSFHEPTDATCVDCHMPRFFDGVLHFSRDHMIVAPDPVLTEKYGVENVPNACGVCHVEKSASWAAEWRERQWGKTPERLVEDVGVVVALRRDPAGVSSETLATLAAREESRLFFRMTALDHLRSRGDDVARAAVLHALGAENLELVQAACVGLGRRPNPAAVGALVKLVEHPVRTISVEAAYAAARAGWRGTTPAFEHVLPDALKMLERQRHFTPHLERIALIAEAMGRNDIFRKQFESLVRLARWAPDRWPAGALDLLHRQARGLAESGEHADALQLYGRVRDLAGEPTPALLFVDSAGSLFAYGQQEEARQVWEYVVARWPKDSPVRGIARARLKGGAEGRTILDELDARLKDDPAAGKLRRRIAWARSQLGSS